MAYRRAKMNWRRFTGKPVRKFRRHVRRHLVKGKGKGKGKGRGFFWTQDDVQVFIKGKGKGHRSHTSGRGFGRKRNPRGRDGSTMKCHACGSEERFIRDCPVKGKDKGPPSGSGMPFSGLAFGPGEGSPTAAEASMTQGLALLSGEGHAVKFFYKEECFPRGQNNDMFLDHPNSVFASLGGEDPLAAQDPWAEAADLLHRNYPTSLLGPPPPRAGSSGQPQVSPGDELSSAS